VASRALGLPITKITIHNADTSRTPNAMPTGGSQGSDVFGLAVKDACEQLLKRLEPFRAEAPEAPWEMIILKAFMSCTSLSCAGFGLPIRNNRDDPHGNRYCVGGAACSVVEVDAMTGDFQILSTTLVQDVGDSLNPAVDIGQIEGGFIQCTGWLTMEELTHTKDGKLATDTAYKYKLPTVATVPRKFVVSLLNKSGTKDNVYSSKGIGEPSFYLGASVYYALLDAINHARKQFGEEPTIVQPPLTVDKIRMAVPDPIAKRVTHKQVTKL
jgi:xanthine dehydrogenase/oxidase